MLAVEPDNARALLVQLVGHRRAGVRRGAARSSAPSPPRAATATEPAVGPRVSAIFETCGIEPVSVQLFPVSVTHIGKPPAALWQSRREAVRAALGVVAGSRPSSSLATRTCETLTRYEQDAARAGANFVEIQNTMLFASVGQRTDAPVATRGVAG